MTITYWKFVEVAKRADVIFKVKAEVFHAHKLVLEAELCGQHAMGKATMCKNR
jgi:hypothetical protein